MRMRWASRTRDGASGRRDPSWSGQQAATRDRPLLPRSMTYSIGAMVRIASGAVLLAIVAVSWIALLTWSIEDPSFTSVADAAPRNWLGRPGAFIADVGLQSLGFAIFLALFAPMYWAATLLRGEPVAAPARRLAVHMAGVVMLAAALSLCRTVPGWPLSHGLGGIAGDRLLATLSTAIMPVVGEFARPLWAAVLTLAGTAFIISATGLSLGRAGRPRANRHAPGFDPPFEPAFEAIRPAATAPASDTFSSAIDTDTRRWGPDMLAPRNARPLRSDALPNEPLGQPEPVMRTAAGGTQRPSEQMLRQYGPYAHTLEALAPDPEADPEFDAWTDASSSGIAARFAPPQNAPHVLQSALATAFGFVGGPTNGRPAAGASGDPDHGPTGSRSGSAGGLIGRIRPGSGERTRTVETYRRPSLNLLSPPAGTRAATTYANSLTRGNGRLLADALAEYGIDGVLRDIEHGPVVTSFIFDLARGTNLTRVVALADDISRHMGVAAVRIVERSAPCRIALELPVSDPAPIMLRDCLDSEAYRSGLDALPIALGRGVTGEPVVVNLAHMPGLLVSGGVGAAKVTGLNAMILSLIYRHGPEDCRFLMIDPGMVDLAVYDGIPHLLTPVVGDPHKAITALAWCVREMDERVKRMAALGVRNIELFNNRVRNARKRGEALQRTVQTGFDDRTGKARVVKEDIDLEPMPYIVIVMEELAPLMAVAGKEIEASVQRLAKAARSAGIHLIVATDRPTGDIVTAPVRASLPARLSYKASSRADSRSVLGEEGAEQLLPGGDSLLAIATGHLVRVHGPSVTMEEVASVASSLKENAAPCYVPELMTAPPVEALANGMTERSGSVAEPGRARDLRVSAEEQQADELYERAVAIAVRDGGASIGRLQGTLKVSAGWAASLLARLESDGVIGPRDARGLHRLRVAGERGVA